MVLEFGMVKQPIGDHWLGIYWCCHILPWTLLQGHTKIGKLKVLITRVLLVLEVWDGKPAYRKSWAGNLLVWSDLTFDPSFKVKRGWPNLKVLFYCVNVSYLVDRCICPAHSRSRQTLEKNASSWALARTGSVLFTRQVAV